MGRRWTAPAVLALVTCVCGGWFLQRAVATGPDAYRHAALLTGNDWDRLEERTTGDYAGVGVQVDARNGWITVVSALQGTPAERAGIRPGDLLVAVEGETVAGWPMERAVQALRGQTGTSVEFSVRREGIDAPISFRLIRERIHQRAVPRGVLVDGGVGYLGMTIVRENSSAELSQEIDRMVSAGARRATNTAGPMPRRSAGAGCPSSYW